MVCVVGCGCSFKLAYYSELFKETMRNGNEMSVNAVRIEAALAAGTECENVLNFTLDVHTGNVFRMFLAAIRGSHSSDVEESSSAECDTWHMGHNYFPLEGSECLQLQGLQTVTHGTWDIITAL
jgi:hypothetical protein